MVGKMRCVTSLGSIARNWCNLNICDMERIYVVSSNIRSIGYDASSMILEVEFLNGSIYQYYDVPEALYEGLMAADSHGKFLNEYIKKGGYRYDRV